MRKRSFPYEESDQLEASLLVEASGPAVMEDILDAIEPPESADPADAIDSARTGFLNDVTQLYLNDIGASPLLTAVEELTLARLVRAGDFQFVGGVFA